MIGADFVKAACCAGCVMCSLYLISARPAGRRDQPGAHRACAPREASRWAPLGRWSGWAQRVQPGPDSSPITEMHRFL